MLSSDVPCFQLMSGQKPEGSPISPPPLQTTIPPARDWSATPRAQTRPDIEVQSLDPKRPTQSRSSSRSSNLEGTKGLVLLFHSLI